MNYTKSILLSLCLTTLSALHSVAQEINWRSIEENKHLVNANFGFEYWVNAGISYGYYVPWKKPVLFNIQLSAPAGKNKLDDYKFKLGAQSELVRVKNFSAIVTTNFIVRRYESSIVRIMGVGAEIGLTIGYYRPHWFVGIQGRLDKAMLSNLKHSDEIRLEFPNIVDGWYKNTGGNFNYNLTTGCSFGKNDIYGKIGLIVTQHLNTKPSIPYYLEIGYNRRF